MFMFNLLATVDLYFSIQTWEYTHSPWAITIHKGDQEAFRILFKKNPEWMKKEQSSRTQMPDIGQPRG